MTTTAVGERPSFGEVRESIAIARSHGEKFFEQIVWQVENEAWVVLGYKSWDDMREAEYADLGVVAPRADRPELVCRLRAKGLTHQQISDTVGASVGTVHHDLIFSSENEDPPEPAITNSRGQQRPAAYQPRQPPATPAAADTRYQIVNTETGEVTGPETPPVAQPPRTPPRKALTEQFINAMYDLTKATERIHRLANDDRWPRNADQIATRHRHDLVCARDLLQEVIQRITQEKEHA